MNLKSKIKRDRQSSYALFSKDVKAIHKYEVDSPPTKIFNTRKEAKRYAEKHGVTDYKILYYQYK